MFKTMIAALLLAASTSLFAQAPQGDAAKAPREERRAKLKAAHEKAAKACEAKKGAEHGACMRKELCAQSADPAKCEARAKEVQANRDKIREACKDKKGDEYRACVREQRGRK